MAPLIQALNISKSFGKYRIINSLSLEIEAGCSYGLVGLNGTGKTTLLRLLLGILKPDEGSVKVLGHTPWLHEEALYRKCGIVLESDGLWGNLTAEENLAVYAAAKGVSNKELKSYINSWWKESGLFDTVKKVNQFSRGQRMQCALCRAFIGEASVFFLDEPVASLDINAYAHFRRLVENARSRGAALIISSHQLDAIDELCDRVGILREGSLVEIERKRNGTEETWFIDAENADMVRNSISEAGADNIKFDGGWHFTLQDSFSKIPGIIRAIVTAGFDIREVRREETDLSSSIRRLYQCTEPKDAS